MSEVQLQSEPQWRNHDCSWCRSKDVIGYDFTPAGGFWVCEYHHWILHMAFDFDMFIPMVPWYYKAYGRESTNS